jgi:uncharacterized membrane protein HdeD (DUF308 family)
LEEIQKHWWAVALRGFIAVIFGLLAFITPAMMLVSLVLVFGCYALVSGIFMFFGAFAVNDANGKMFRILEGIFLIVIGLLFLFNPALSVMAAVIYIAVWAIITGIFQIYYSVAYRKQMTGEWWGILNGVISLLFGIVLMMNLIAGAEVLIMVLGIYSIFFGVVSIALAFKLKNLKTQTA